MVNVGLMRNNIGKNLVEIFGLFLNEEIFFNIKIWINRNVVKKRIENLR